jgi:hypothetical protein
MRNAKLLGATSLRPAAAILLLTAAPLACSKAPAEPEATAAPAETSSPAVSPLLWDAPGTWTVMAEGRSGKQKAAYKVPKAGNDKEEAEMTVLFYGTGSEGDVDRRLKEWFADFDGDVGGAAKRETFEVHGMKVEMVDTMGTYKLALGPKIGPKQKSPMQMVKHDYRMLGAVVKTPDRGNWFFKLIGPDETVQAARPTFRTMLESAR